MTNHWPGGTARVIEAYKQQPLHVSDLTDNVARLLMSDFGRSILIGAYGGVSIRVGEEVVLDYYCPFRRLFRRHTGGRHKSVESRITRCDSCIYRGLSRLFGEYNLKLCG